MGVSTLCQLFYELKTTSVHIPTQIQMYYCYIYIYIIWKRQPKEITFLRSEMGRRFYFKNHLRRNKTGRALSFSQSNMCNLCWGILGGWFFCLNVLLSRFCCLYVVGHLFHWFSRILDWVPSALSSLLTPRSKCEALCAHPFPQWSHSGTHAGFRWWDDLLHCISLATFWSAKFVLCRCSWKF